MKPWQNEVTELALKRHEIRESMIQFEHTLGEAVFQQESNIYKQNISKMSRELNRKIDSLNRFEKIYRTPAPIRHCQLLPSGLAYRYYRGKMVRPPGLEPGTH